MARVSKEQKSRITAEQAFNAAYRPGAKIKTEDRAIAVRQNSPKKREYQQVMSAKRQVMQDKSGMQKKNQITRERMEKGRDAARSIQRAFEDAAKRQKNANKKMDRVR